MKRATVVVVLLLTQAAHAGELTSAGPLAMRAPDSLVLGRDATASIHLRDEPGLRLVTSAGTLSEPITDVAEKRVTLTLPAEHFPQVAIVAAITADGTVRDWLAIPLAGQARVKVNTDRNASVIVRLGTSEFGPVNANAAGVAHLDIIVPPGITQAKTVATGKNGAVREKPMPLGAQPFRRVLAICSDLGDSVTLVATLPDRTPAPSVPRLLTSTGTLDAPTSQAPGVFVVTHRPDGASDTAAITAGFPGEDRVAGTCTLKVPAESPSAIQVVADRAQHTAGTGAVALSVTFTYPGARRPLEITTIAIEPEIGTVAAPQRADKGFTAVWTVPDAFAGKRSARATVRAALPRGEITASFELPLVAAAPVRVVTSVPPHILADGLAHASIAVRVVDRFDNAVASPKLSARARGTISTFTSREDGASIARYTAPRTRTAGDDVVELVDTASGLTARAPIRLEPLPHRFAFAARLGYFSNLARVSSPVAAVSAHARLPILRERLIVGVEVAGYARSLDAEAMDIAEPISGRIMAAPVLARIAYRMPLGPLDMWLGGGAGVAFASSQLESASSGMTRSSAVRFAATGFVGGALRTGPGWIVVEGGYLHATLSEGPVVGRIGGIMATAGFAIELR